MGQMSKSLASFNAFYKSKHKNRMLEWNHALGTVTITAQFESGEKELSLSMYQGIILLLFQNENRLPYKEILLRSGLSEFTSALDCCLGCGLTDRNTSSDVLPQSRRMPS